MAAAPARIAAAISVFAGPRSASGKYSTLPSQASLVDELETTEVEMTHD
jgi:hypothetical protein